MKLNGRGKYLLSLGMNELSLHEMIYFGSQADALNSVKSTESSELHFACRIVKSSPFKLKFKVLIPMYICCNILSGQCFGSRGTIQ